MRNHEQRPFTRGGQIVFHNLRMFVQINKTILKANIVFLLLLMVVMGLVLISKEEAINYVHYYLASILEPMHLDPKLTMWLYGRPMELTPHVILQDKYLATVVSHVNGQLILAAIGTFAFSLVLFLVAVWFFVRKGKKQAKNHYIRGAKIVKPDVLKKMIVKRKEDSDLSIDGLPLIKNSETQHMLMHGTVGMGKSQTIMKVMDCLRARGDRVIVYDKGCNFIPAYYQEQTDIILNPFDERCANWDLWAEAPYDHHIDNMAESLIPMHGETDPFWVDAARTVFTSVASSMRHDPDRSLDKLLRLLLTDEVDTLEKYLTGTPAATLVSGKTAKTAISIRSVITTYLKSLQSLRGLARKGSPAFSIRDYLLNPNAEGWLFVSSNGDQHKSLKPLISMWLAMSSLTLLSLPEDRERRIWFICDELPSLHKLPLLGETIAEVRKFGGCFVLGMQSFMQLVKVYGRSGAGEIFDLLNTRAFFCSPGAEMAQLVSKELGFEDVDEARESVSYGANSIRDGISLGTQRSSRPIVSYTEIMALKALEGYLRVPGDYPITKFTLSHQDRAKHACGFMPREIPPFKSYKQTSVSVGNHTDESCGEERETKHQDQFVPELNTLSYLD